MLAHRRDNEGHEKYSVLLSPERTEGVTPETDGDVIKGELDQPERGDEEEGGRGMHESWTKQLEERHYGDYAIEDCRKVVTENWR